MLLSRSVLSIAIALSVASTNASAAASNVGMACFQLFDHLKKVEIITLRQAETKPTALTVVKEHLAQTEASLAQLLEMHTMTPDVGLGIKDNRIKLGLNLEDGYSLEIVYKADARDQWKFTLEEGKLISPTNRSKTLTHNFLDFKILDLRSQSTFDLSDIYPDGKDLKVKIPMVLEGPIMAKFKKLLNLKYLKDADKFTIRELAQKYPNKWLNYMVHRNAFGAFIAERAKRYSVTFVLGLTLVAAAQGDYKGFYEKFMPDNKEWVQDSLVNMENRVPKELNSQLAALQALAEAAVQENQTPSNIKGNLDQPRIKISQTQYVWVTTGHDEQTGKTKTYFIVAHDNRESTIEYIAIEVDEEKFADLITYVKKSGKNLVSNK